MTDEERFEAWLAKVCERPMPEDESEQVQLLARELAEGAIKSFWAKGIDAISDNIMHDKACKYLFVRWEGKEKPGYTYSWDGNAPHISLLIRNGYISKEGAFFQPTKTAFELLKAPGPTTIFISYRRSESSAFALLVLCRLKQQGLEAFLDMALQPGEDWHAGLKERIQRYKHFVLLLGKDTLNSIYVRKEILWALEANLTILPIWHNGFEYNRADWPDLEPEIDEILRTRQPILVVKENAREYNDALTELLKCFGVRPG